MKVFALVRWRGNTKKSVFSEWLMILGKKLCTVTLVDFVNVTLTKLFDAIG